MSGMRIDCSPMTTAQQKARETSSTLLLCDGTQNYDCYKDCRKRVRSQGRLGSTHPDASHIALMYQQSTGLLGNVQICRLTVGELIRPRPKSYWQSCQNIVCWQSCQDEQSTIPMSECCHSGAPCQDEHRHLPHDPPTQKHHQYASDISLIN